MRKHWMIFGISITFLILVSVAIAVLAANGIITSEAAGRGVNQVVNPVNAILATVLAGIVGVATFAKRNIM